MLTLVLPSPPHPYPPTALTPPSRPLLQSENKYTDKVRLGDLPKEERKVVNKVFNANKLKNSENTNACMDEIGAMLTCFEANEWETLPCQPQINEMYACEELHKNDPVSGREGRNGRGGRPPFQPPPFSSSAPPPAPTPRCRTPRSSWRAGRRACGNES